MKAPEIFLALCAVVFLLGLVVAIGGVVAMIWSESVVAMKVTATAAFLSIVGLIAGLIALPEKKDRA